jgi:hypothetical protein
MRQALMRKYRKPFFSPAGSVNVIAPQKQIMPNTWLHSKMIRAQAQRRKQKDK